MMALRISAARVPRSAGRRWISSSQLTVEPRPTKERPVKEKLTFGTTFSDHMLTIAWKDGVWEAPHIGPYQNLSISPAASALHYGLQCFEGMKAYRAVDGSVRLFRPQLNMKRLKSSMERLNMPGSDFDEAELLECLSELVRLDQSWIPEGEGYSLYIRPTVIATHKFLGLSAPTSLLLYVITSPVGPYYPTGFQPIRLTADTPYVRAWPGGTGNTKVGGNYAPTMKAMTPGYSQVLWLLNDELTEVGAMNLFVVWQNRDGETELVTAPLSRGDILPGVTRDSVVQLAQKWMKVSERSITMTEVKEAASEGRLLEVFGTGTAAVVTPVSCIRYKGEDIEIPAPGTVTERVWDEITGIQYGKVEGPEGWSVVL